MSERNKSGIYVIRNKVNGKSYVGQAISIGDRWYTHKSHLNIGRHHNRHLQSSWRKHGESSFEFLVLEYVKINAQLLVSREQHWMDKLYPEYNIAPAAGSSIGLKHPPRSDEFRQKMSEMKKGQKHSAETIRLLKQIAAQSNYRHSPEIRKRISESQKGKKKPPEEIERMRLRATGVKQSPETIAKRVEKLVGRIVSQETRNKIGESNRGKLKGRKLTEEHKQAISRGNTGKSNQSAGDKLKGRKRPAHVIKALAESNEQRYAERRVRIRAALIEHPDMSGMAIARMLGVDRGTVLKYRKEIQCQRPMPSANASGAKSSQQKKGPLSKSHSSVPQQLSLPLG